MRVGSSKMAIFDNFTRHIFRTFTSQATIIILRYVVPQQLFGDTEIGDLEWSFCVKIWFELGIQWVGVMAFGENCSEIYRATHIHRVRKKGTNSFLGITSSNTGRFSKFFQCHNLLEICKETVIKFPTPQTRRYTTLLNTHARKLVNQRFASHHFVA